MAGAAFAHNFGLASSADGPTANGKIAVVIGIVVVAAIAVINSMRKEEAWRKRTERRMRDEASRRKRAVLPGASHSDKKCNGFKRSRI